MMMCGMSAAFSAIFGTPMAAAIFAMEVVAVGIMHYSALVPCVIASLVARYFASFCGVPADRFELTNIPSFSLLTSVEAAGLAILCAFVSILFCVSLHKSTELFQRFFKNPYLRILIGGGIIVVLTLLVGSQYFNGSGISQISVLFAGDGKPFDFLLKILFSVDVS